MFSRVSNVPFSNGQGCPWFHTAAMFFAPQKTRVLASKNWQGCTFRSGTDAAGIKQKRCFDVRQNSPSKIYKDVHSEKRHGCRWYYTAAMFFASAKNSRPRIDKDVNSWTAWGIAAVAIFKRCTSVYNAWERVWLFIKCQTRFLMEPRPSVDVLKQQFLQCCLEPPSAMAEVWGETLLL